MYQRMGTDRRDTDEGKLVDFETTLAERRRRARPPA
jgi:hypothetical protein